jgi:hypothetical protein
MAAMAVTGAVGLAGCGGGGDATGTTVASAGTTVASAIVPDVSGLTGTQAARKLRAAGLLTTVHFSYAATPDG